MEKKRELEIVLTGQLIPSDKSALWNGTPIWGGSWLSAIVEVDTLTAELRTNRLRTTETRYLPFLNYPPNSALP